MRKLLLIFIFIVTVAITYGQSYIYHPFPDSNAMWTDRTYDPMCNLMHECSINQYRITGDTLINGKIYKKLTKSGYLISQSFQYTYYSEYAGAIRQEINNKKVFYFPPYYFPQVDTLFYDFNLNLGDSLPLSYLYPFNSCDAVIDAIDSIAIGNSYYKRFRISTTYGPPLDTTWLIEGIGSSKGLFGGYCSSWESWQYLTCFVQNDTLTYPTPPNSDCDFITYISKSNFQTNSILLLPNPAHDRFTVELPLLTGNAKLSLLDVNGIELLNRPITDIRTTIDIRDLAKGVYFIKIIREKIVELRKIIKE